MKGRTAAVLLFLRVAIVIVAVNALVVPAPAGAQVRADPGTVINGRVAVRVYVTLSDDDTPYAPIGGVRLRFFRTTADTATALRTDDAGTATVMLTPGEYRLVSSSAVEWKGTRYSWNTLIVVQAGIPTVELTSASANRVAISAADSRRAAAVPADPDALAPSADAPALMPKDPSMATMLSFFLPGSGQMYAGERVKGGALLAIAATGGAIAVHSLSCAAASDCDMSTGGRLLGAAGMLAYFSSWIYGIVDAGDAARRFNDRPAVMAARPFVAPDRHGGTRLGFTVRLPR
jgi:hypothetical protein